MNIPSILTETGWNRRSLTQLDFDNLCERSAVTVLTLTMPAEGLYTEYKNHPVIVLSAKLKYPQSLFVAFHELAHHLLNHSGISRFDQTSINKAERQANLIAACALIPLPELQKYKNLENPKILDFEISILQTRFEIYKLHRI